MTTRSKTTKTEEENGKTKKPVKLDADHKVFFFNEKLINESDELYFEYFYHPGKGKPAIFVTDQKNKNLLEVKEFSEPHRSWLIDSQICSNGKLYITVPFDTTFFALYHLKKFCSDKAMALEDIVDDEDPSVNVLLTQYIVREHLEVVADVKTAAGMKYYKYDPQKTLKWLAVKARRLVECLKRENIYCGVSAVSTNYKKSETVEKATNELDYLRSACDIVGSYVDLEEHDRLKEHLGIKEMETKVANNKRKSVKSSDTSLSKKIKMEDSSSETVDESPKLTAPVKEKKITAKEKALAKGAKGTKSISSFFKK